MSKNRQERMGGDPVVAGIVRKMYGGRETMSGDLYLRADELDAADRVYELALEKRGPLTDAEKNEARKAARDAKRAIADAVTAAQAVVDATDF
jgi:hypothetical protein